jgi:hypothetical protein
MFSPAARLIRAAITGVALVACADSNPPTQPVARSPERVATLPTVAADISTASTPTTIYACYVVGKGAMYRIKTADTPAACEKKDVEFSWTDSPASKISGLIFASAVVTLPSSGRYVATCPEGKSLINFGAEIPLNSTTSPSDIIGNRPALVEGKIAWGFHATPGTSWVFYWTCADAEGATSAT